MQPKLPTLLTRFPEPVVESGADPYVVTHAGFFYYCHVINDAAVYMRKATSLDQIGKAEPVQIWKPPKGMPYTDSIWAPELHQWDGKWYIYFAAGERDELYSHQRMYVLEGVGDDPLTAAYTLKGKVADSSDQWAIDGTILCMDNDDRYFVWSGWSDLYTLEQNLYIAKMKNPWTLEGERVCIASPIFEWERHKIGINEGPQVVPQGNRRHIIYSASHSSTDYYCLGQISLVGDDPLDPTHWVKQPEPIYQSHRGIIAPGHASFILTPDELYGWMIFHTAKHAGAGWNREVRLAAFELLKDGSFKFIPRSLLHTIAHPRALLKLLREIIHTRGTAPRANP